MMDQVIKHNSQGDVSLKIRSIFKPSGDVSLEIISIFKPSVDALTETKPSFHVYLVSGGSITAVWTFPYLLCCLLW